MRIMETMRVLLLALMIALLPLRGWLGDAMAVQHPAAATVAGEHEGHGMQHLHHTTQDASHAAAHGAHHADSHSDHPDCTSCQVCHSVVLAAMVLPPQGDPLPLAAPRTLQRLHASAEPSPDHRPPIG